MDKKKIELTILISLSLVISLIEALIPLSQLFTGVKLGLANVVVLFVLYKYSYKEAFFVSIIRIIVFASLRGGLTYTFIFSLSGGIMSLLMMSVFKYLKLFSIIGISIIGSVTHVSTQVIVASILLNSFFANYLKILIPVSVIFGIVIGKISKEILVKLKIIDL